MVQSIKNLGFDKMLSRCIRDTVVVGTKAPNREIRLKKTKKRTIDEWNFLGVLLGLGLMFGGGVSARLLGLEFSVCGLLLCFCGVWG